MFKCNYTEINDQSPIPLVRLQLKNIDNCSSVIEKDGILDTGADCTLIPFSTIAKLQPKSLIRGRHNQIIYGVGNSKIITVPYRILMSFDQENFIKIKVYACPDDDTNGLIILGRNFLNRYRITFDGKAKLFIIE
ncbi:retropepsin-like aspartic protease [Geminocystis sp. CENA526]|uniref:retropepsin-like aspartic protease n=1 Tax=Geminocystis sp. CENA526 TaxID=1355871 RepID=UPI003D6DB785